MTELVFTSFDPEKTGAFEGKVKGVLSVWLVLLAAGFVLVSLSWPMVGDVTFMHYVVLLIRHGMTPYRDIVDMNLPGSYLLEASAMKLFGSGARGWRLYDFTLLTAGSAALFTILRRQGRFAGLVAATLFLLIHGQDGTIMSGERDLAAAVLLLCAVAFLFSAIRQVARPLSSLVFSFLFGGLSSFAACVKPTLVSAAVCLLLWAVWEIRRRRSPLGTIVSSAFAGLLLPPLATLAFLKREHAFGAFLGEMHGLIPYHASIDQRTIGYLMTHSISPLLPLLVLWLIAAFLLKDVAADSERIALLLCALCGLLSYVLQRKGFAYQRYPFTAFLLPLFLADFARLSRQRSIVRFGGIAATLVAVALSTQCFVRLTRFVRTDPPRPLLTDLSAFGSPDALSGHIQCMDTIGSCLDNLYAARIVQSTGFLYDCYLLGGKGVAGYEPVTLDLRRRFWQQMDRNPPRLIVVTDSVCYEQTPNFEKYANWPEFEEYLAANYVLARQSGPQKPVHYWSRPNTPFGYRIYLHR